MFFGWHYVFLPKFDSLGFQRGAGDKAIAVPCRDVVRFRKKEEETSNLSPVLQTRRSPTTATSFKDAEGKLESEFVFCFHYNPLFTGQSYLNYPKLL